MGGTDDEGEWSRTPSMETAEAILRRCRDPGSLASVERRVVQPTRSGCGPSGPPYDSSGLGDVVHCYGHGGAGVTLSWGVADEVVSLA